MSSATIPDLVGAKEACEILGIKSPNLRDVLRLGGLPEPQAEWTPGCRALQLAAGGVWLAEDVRALAERRRARTAAMAE